MNRHNKISKSSVSFRLFTSDKNAKLVFSNLRCTFKDMVFVNAYTNKVSNFLYFRKSYRLGMLCILDSLKNGFSIDGI